jgi:GT2 family glycosyltransferase
VSVASARLGVVVIGRNEGERLLRCLASLSGAQARVVYVDSGSADASVASARAGGAQVVELSSDLPFSAARARNAGFERLLQLDAGLAWVQFIDGDCELLPAWWSALDRWLPGDPSVAVVCGRLRERRREASLYNRLCDLEWQAPAGLVPACGGNALMRVAAFRESGGFRSDMIAGEEPELCLRLRSAGWQILRLPSEMALHDAALRRFSEWWRRAIRSGHAYAECYALHGRAPVRFRARELRSILAFGLGLPALAFGLAIATDGLSLLALGAYGVLWLRVRGARLALGNERADASLYATFVVIGKWAEAAGVLRFAWDRLRGRRGKLIEFRRPAA